MRYFLLAGVLVFLSGCLNLDPVPETTRYFMLDQNLAAAGSGEANVRWQEVEAIHVGRPVIPEYLNTPRIFYRTSTGEPRYTQRERWAEAMVDSLPRTLARHLSNLSGINDISYYPAPAAESGATRIQWEIIQFEGIENRGAIIDLQFRIGDQPRQRIRHEIRLESFDNIDTLVAAMNDLLLQAARSMIE
jgi:uncharacterized lipoprotein YmbA